MKWYTDSSSNWRKGETMQKIFLQQFNRYTTKSKKMIWVKPFVSPVSDEKNAKCSRQHSFDGDLFILARVFPKITAWLHPHPTADLRLSMGNLQKSRQSPVHTHNKHRAPSLCCGIIPHACRICSFQKNTCPGLDGRQHGWDPRFCWDSMP